MEWPLPFWWNRSRATALAATLSLHVIVAAWLLAERAGMPAQRPMEVPPIWLPVLRPLEPPPPGERPTVIAEPWVEPATAIRPEFSPEAPVALPTPDWLGEARAVAGAIGREPQRRTFGEMPKAPAGRPKEEYPPSIYEPPLPRVGTTTTSPEGETVLWVSDNCYIPLESTSLTMRHFHEARQGIRRCQIGLGRKKPRGDLFDHLKRQKPEPQE